MTSNSRFRDLLVRRLGDDGWTSLPRWASFWIHIGEAVEARPQSFGRLTVFVAAPTRSYATALTAAGIVARESLSQEPADPETHFWTEIAPLDSELPAPVKALTDDGCIVETVLKSIEFDERGGADRLRARIQWFKEQDRFVYLDESLFLRPLRNASYEERSLLRRHPPDHYSDFVEALPWVGSAAQYAFRSRTICDICGHASHLKPSFHDVSFGLPLADGGYAQGPLQDVVRVDRWTGKGEGFRSRLILPSGSIEEDSFKPARVVVFNGAKNYLKREQLWPAADQVIVLAHHERSASQAADRLRRRLVQSKRLVDLLPREEVPLGVELIAFAEGRND